MTTETAITFNGSKREQELAQQVFELLRMQGWMYADDTPIRQSLANLAEFLAGRDSGDAEATAREIDTALGKNTQVFQREEADGIVIFTTYRTGHPSNWVEERDRHMFRQRLYEPENPLPTDDISVVVSLNRPALTTVEPVFISDYWQQQAGLTPISPLIDDLGAEEPAPVEAAPVAEEPAPVEVALVAEEPAPVEVALVAEEPALVAEEPAPSLVTLVDGIQADFAQPVEVLMTQHGRALSQRLRDALENDPLRRIVFFGRLAAPEAAVINLGKNDLRRIKDYIIEVGEPVSDSQIISDLYHRNQRDDGFENMRFSLNYRLGREKDFAFVGVEGARLWSVSNLPTIGTKRLKASEMAQILTYLTEGYDDSVAEVSAETIAQTGKVDLLLTFFEWQYGLLPFTEALRPLLPTPMLDNQRTSVLRFESPQHYSAYMVELRYPTSNRGGWLQGLEDFFREHVVPGALITIGRTEEPNVFTITYEEAGANSDRLLTLDEKKNKFTFSEWQYYCAVDADLLPNQQRYGRLRNLKMLPMGERRKEDLVLEHVFKTMGDQIGTRSEPLYSASLQDLYVAMNVLRPTSRALLFNLLEKGDLFENESEQTYLYKPEPEETDDEGDEAEETDYDQYDEE